MKEAVYHQYAENLQGGHWWVQHRRRILERWLTGLGVEPDGKRAVLEIGSGVGVEHDFFERYGSVTGVELSSVGAEYCRQRGYAQLIEGDLNTVSLPEASFDLAADFHVLYHQWVGDPADVLRRIHAALRPGGRLLLTEPAFEILRRAHDEVVMAARRWSRSGLVRLVEDSGFEIERFSAMLSLVAPAALFGALTDRFRSAHDDIHELRPSSQPVEAVIRGVMAAERGLIRAFPLPFGTCWALVAQKR